MIRQPPPSTPNWNGEPAGTSTGEMLGAATFAAAARTLPESASPASEDLALVERARAGDRRALRRIYETQRRGVGRHLLRLLGDPAVVDDLVQETFVTAFRQLDRYDGTARLSTWLSGIARNLARNHHAKVRRRRHLLEAHGPGPGAMPQAAPAPDATARQRQALDLLYAALDTLPAPQREAFVVRILERRPLEEAARILDAPVATVSYRARKAEARVRALLRERGIEP